MRLVFDGQTYETGEMVYVHVAADVAGRHALLGLYLTRDYRTVLGLYLHGRLGVHVDRPKPEELRLYLAVTGSSDLRRAIDLLGESGEGPAPADGPPTGP